MEIRNADFAAAYRAAREWARQHGHNQPDDRMIDAALQALLSTPCGDLLTAELTCARIVKHNGWHETRDPRGRSVQWP